MGIKDLKSEQVQAIICICLLLGCTVTVFEYTKEIRKPYFGELSDGLHVWLSASTLKFAKNWYREGPLNLRFGLFENPASIEFPDLSSREPYLSYPPGSVIPIYLLSVITGNEPSIPLIMDYNLSNHFLIAFFLALMIFIFLRQIKVDLVNSFLFAIIPILLELLLPAPLYWHQNVFFSDQAVILPFVLYIFLEVIQDGLKDRYMHFFCILQNLVLFYGFLTDWLFIFIAGTVYIKRIFEGKIKVSRNISHFFKESFKFWLAPIIAVIIYLYQLYSFSGFSKVLNRVIFRTGISNDGQNIPSGYGPFLHHFIEGYGDFGYYALVFALVILIILVLFILSEKVLKKNIDFKIKRICTLMAILLIPCILQVLVFRNHSLLHDFSVLKFSVPLATIPFVLAPISLYLILKSYINIHSIKVNLRKNLKADLGLLLIFILMFTVSGVYLVNEHHNYKNFFKEGDGYYELVGNSIQKNTNFSDIVFSPNFDIPYNPPQKLSLSMKRVYKINSIEDIKNYTQGISNFDIVIMFVGPPGKKWEKTLSNYTKIQDGNFYYYKLN